MGTTTAFIEPAAAVTIIAALLIVLALVYFLVMTILQLVKINRGLDVVLGAVGEIISKSAPVNGIVDTINGTLAQGRDLLERLLLKKAGDDSAGLVESLFPGEGRNFLRRVRKHGPVRNIREVYTRGVTTLAHLGRTAPIGEAHEVGPAIRDTAYASAAAGKLYTPSASRTAGSPVVGTDAPQVFDPSTMPESEGEGAPPTQGTGGAAQEAPASSEEPAQEPESASPAAETQTEAEAESPEPGREQSAPPAEESAPAPSEEDQGGTGRIDVRGSRPWER